MVSSGAAPGAQDREPIPSRQPKVQNHGIVGFGLAQEVGLVPVSGTIDGVAGRLEGTHKMVGDAVLVFDQKQPQRVSPRPLAVAAAAR